MKTMSDKEILEQIEWYDSVSKRANKADHPALACVYAGKADSLRELMLYRNIWKDLRNTVQEMGNHYEDYESPQAIFQAVTEAIDNRFMTAYTFELEGD